MTICYRCDINLATKSVVDKKYLDEEGNKPCFECILEIDEELHDADQEE